MSIFFSAILSVAFCLQCNGCIASSLSKESGSSDSISYEAGPDIGPLKRFVVGDGLRSYFATGEVTFKFIDRPDIVPEIRHYKEIIENNRPMPRRMISVLNVALEIEHQKKRFSLKKELEALCGKDSSLDKHFFQYDKSLLKELHTIRRDIYDDYENDTFPLETVNRFLIAHQKINESELRPVRRVIKDARRQLRKKKVKSCCCFSVGVCGCCTLACLILSAGVCLGICISPAIVAGIAVAVNFC